jgi:Tfp pilus assembly protein PilF/predicted regulator of Ras-like GTPase activity (Roadblock/LC7/MglB family)
LKETEAIEAARAEVEAYRRLLARNPGSLCFAEYADRLREAGMISDATRICARGLSRHPGYATGHVVMGEVFLERGLPEKAEREWLEALRFDPGHPRGHLRLGELYMSRGETARAMVEFRSALLHRPDFPEAQARVAELCEEVAGGADAREAPQPEEQWRPGDRPAWLTGDRLEELVETVAACDGVESAALANRDGLVLAGSLPPGADPGTGPVGALRLVEEARSLLRRLAAGRLKAALMCGAGGGVRCLPLDDLTLVAGISAEAPPGAVQRAIEHVLAHGDRAPQDVEKAHG